MMANDRAMLYTVIMAVSLFRLATALVVGLACFMSFWMPLYVCCICLNLLQHRVTRIVTVGLNQNTK